MALVSIFHLFNEKQVYKYITLLYFVVSGTVSIFTKQNDKIRTMIYWIYLNILYCNQGLFFHWLDSKVFFCYKRKNAKWVSCTSSSPQELPDINPCCYMFSFYTPCKQKIWFSGVVGGIAVTIQKMKFSFKDFFSKCDQIREFSFMCVTWNSLSRLKKTKPQIL